MTRLVLVAILLCLTACGHASESPLQRYDALRPTLQTATGLAGAVSSDVYEINLGMKHDNRRWIRKVAGRLRLNAARLGRVTRLLRLQVIDIRRDDSGEVRRYLDLILSALSKQRYEALWAGRLAGTVHRDPLLLSPRNFAAAIRQSRMATRSAASSVRLAAAARAVKTGHRSSFRYVRVTPHQK